MYSYIITQALFSPLYREGPGPAGKATEAEVVLAEMGFDLPTSATNVRLAVWGGKDYGLHGWMLVDKDELVETLLLAGYEEKELDGFRVGGEMYPDLAWFELPASDVLAGYRHPDNGSEVTISTRQSGDKFEVFFNQWVGHRSPVTWRYFE